MFVTIRDRLIDGQKHVAVARRPGGASGDIGLCDVRLLVSAADRRPGVSSVTFHAVFLTPIAAADVDIDVCFTSMYSLIEYYTVYDGHFLIRFLL